MTRNSVQSKTSKNRKKKIIIAAVAAGALLAGGGLWWALKPADEYTLGTPEAVIAGEKFAAALVDGDAAIAQGQIVASPDLFQYADDAEDLVTDDAGFTYIANQLVVSTAHGAGIAEVQAVANDIGARLVGVNTFLGDYQLLLDEAMSEDDLVTLGERVAKKAGIDSAEGNLVTRVSFDAMGASGTGEKWEGNWGSSLGSADAGNWGMQALGAPAIWEYADAHPGELETTTVGVVDAFWRGQWHKDLEPDPLTLLPAGDVNADSESHGLHVSGIIATRQDQLTGVRGVAPSGHLVIASAGDVRGDPAFWQFNRVSTDAALTFVIESGARVVNMSFGAGTDDARKAQEGDAGALRFIRKWGDDRASALNKLLATHDFVVVNTSGNASCTQTQIDQDKLKCTIAGSLDATTGLKGSAAGTALEDRLITVGATSALDDRDGFEIGWYSNGNVDVAAPGTDINSLANGDGYKTNTGTSMAAPHVSGLAATLFGADPNLSAADVKKIIVGTAGSAPTARWNLQSDATTSAPIVNGATAFQVALMTSDLDTAERVGFIDEVFAGAVSVAGTEMSAQLLGTWCDPTEGAGKSSCFNLQDYLTAKDTEKIVLRPGDPEGDSLLTPDDATGLGSVTSTFALCTEGACGTKDAQVTLRYYPPGAVSAAGSNSPAHNVSYPRIAQVTWSQGGDAVMGDPYRLTLDADATFSQLPFEANVRPPLSVDALDGTWRSMPAAGQAAKTMVIRGTTVFLESGQSAQLLPTTPHDDGTVFLSVIAEGYSSCADGMSVCAPLGQAIPAGTLANIPADYGIEDVLDADRIWSSQSGQLYLRDQLPSEADFPAKLRGAWCARDGKDNCFSVSELLESTPTAFVSSKFDSADVAGATDISLCLVADLGPGSCTTAASMFLRYLPVGTEWDCATAGAAGTLPFGFTTCKTDYSAAHESSKQRLLILPNHQHDLQYVDSIPMYRD